VKIKSQILLIVLVLFLLCFFYVWPGVCRYEYYDYSTLTGRRTRIDKLTEKVEWYHPRVHHWVPAPR